MKYPDSRRKNFVETRREREKRRKIKTEKGGKKLDRYDRPNSGEGWTHYEKEFWTDWEED